MRRVLETPIPAWADRQDAVEVRFVGLQPPPTDDPPRLGLGYDRLQQSRLRQIHSAAVLTATPGCPGKGDALVTDQPGLALCVMTADCVPVVLAREHQLAAVHAGWRGIAQGVVDAAAARLEPVGSAVAWIGPAIGACCYEVGPDVANQVAAASEKNVILHPKNGRYHLDLRAAVRSQLRSLRFDDVRELALCTRCEPGWASYRRDGPRVGRNWAVAWMASA